MSAQGEDIQAQLAAAPRRHFVDTAELVPAGPARSLFRLVQPALDRLFGFHQLNEVYRRTREASSDVVGFCRAGMAELGVGHSLGTEEALDGLRRWDGPLLALANHPLGGVDALAFCLAMEEIRPGGWQLMANRMLTDIPEFQGRLLALDPFAAGEAAGLNRRSLLQALHRLKGGGVLGLFPAGRVALHDPDIGGPSDLAWSTHALRMAQKAGAAIVLLNIGGRTGAPLSWVPLSRPRLRSLFLVRELLKPRDRQIGLRFSPLLMPDEVARMDGDTVHSARLRAQCLALADLDPIASITGTTSTPGASASAQPAPARPALPPVRAAGDPAELSREVARLSSGPALLMHVAPFRLLLFKKAEAPALFHELGRQRELTFRLAGQGSGLDFDETPEDAWYTQLALWDDERDCLIGAYRLGFSDQVIAEHGTEGMYLNHVFDIQPGFYERMGPGIELSRSFVRARFQGEQRPLALLWRGLGEVIARNPRYRNLYGSVTISAAYSPLGRATLVEYLRRNHSEHPAWRELVKARTPFAAQTRYHGQIADAFAGPSVDALRPIIALSESGLRPIPPLIRHYLPLGARFIDFHVEAEFGNAVYCLLRVDLARSPRGHLRRFVGNEAADRLLAEAADTSAE
ncbi:MAG: lysophospholipid acyltransferase family protein [Xanthomonadaceae bacterium]|nr:lysophospholipid acyltransferase family protein [Xanthomonadaceae bacterium]